MLEKKHERLLPRGQFAWRMVRFAAAAGLVILFALGLGVAGYHWIAGFDLDDSLLNAAMILAGEGPTKELQDPWAKRFASCYALFSGLVFVTVAGVLFTPLIHRIIHIFHVDESRK